MKRFVTTLTERGQISMPAALRKQLCLKPGQSFMWERVSDDECRIFVVRENRSCAKSMRGFMKRFQTDSSLPKKTADWMKLLRAGERG